VTILDRKDDNLNNNLSRYKNFLKSHATSIIFLLLLIVIVSIITYYRILVQIQMGAVSDSYDFLANALVFAGQGMGYSDLLRPPLFSFIISLIFRLGYVSVTTIFYVDGGLFVFGIIGMFMLLKLKFTDLESFLGGLIYATFPITLLILGFGFSDLASVSFSIWTIYLFVLAVKRDSNFFYLAFPFAMFAFLTRYNNALLILPIIFYLLINKDKINFKNIFGGIIASLLIILPVLVLFYQKFGNFLYPFLNFGVTSSAVIVSSESASYNPSIFYFIQNFPTYIGVTGLLVMLILFLGVVVYSIQKFHQNRNKINIFDVLDSKSKSFKIKLSLFVAILLVFLASFGMTIYLVSELLFFVIAYLLYDLTNDMKNHEIGLHFMFLVWFMAFFIFSSVFVIKNPRYFLLMTPPIVYFMILGLGKVSNILGNKFQNKNAVFSIIALIITSVILLSSAYQIPFILYSNGDEVITNEQVQLASQWFINYDPNYKSQNIYSDLWPNLSWYLKTDVKPVPVFKDNQTFIDGVKMNTFNQEDSNQFNNYLVTNNADYYFCIRPGLNLTSYKPIKEFNNDITGPLIVYKRV
jgi:4-amino-4-deoxy-L-arabinose transferase-like glycosyltransferase